MARTTILSVAAEPLHQKNLRKILSAQGYEVAAAFSAAEAELILNILGASPAAAVIASPLPEEGGLGFARRLRKNPKFARLAILLIAERADAEECRQALEPDGIVNCVISHPFRAEELSARLKGLLALRRHAPHSGAV